MLARALYSIEREVIHWKRNMIYEQKTVPPKPEFLKRLKLAHDPLQAHGNAAHTYLPFFDFDPPEYMLRFLFCDFGDLDGGSGRISSSPSMSQVSVSAVTPLLSPPMLAGNGDIPSPIETPCSSLSESSRLFGRPSTLSETFAIAVLFFLLSELLLDTLNRIGVLFTRDADLKTLLVLSFDCVLGSGLPAPSSDPKPRLWSP
jgi:hypothetical protein